MLSFDVAGVSSQGSFVVRGFAIAGVFFVVGVVVGGLNCRTLDDIRWTSLGELGLLLG